MLVLVASFAVYTGSVAAQRPTAAGVWSGFLQVPGREFPVTISLQNKDGDWSGTVEVPALNIANHPLSKIAVEDSGTILFAVGDGPTVPTFRGTLSSDGKTFSGEVAQGALKAPFKLTRMAGEAEAPAGDQDTNELLSGFASASGPLAERNFLGSMFHPAIDYTARPVNDAVAELNRKIREGEVHLKSDGEPGYLRSILDALNIPIESQMAVFSKTSVQAPRIGPQNPRTLFFNDSVVVGWVRGGFVELASHDPHQGAVFYILDPKSADTPQLVRRYDCLGCHVSFNTLDVPGMLLRSVYTAPNGDAKYQFGSYISDHRTPLEERWGGWYVTAKLNSIRHLGNAMVTDAEKPESMVTEKTLNVESLKEKFDTGAYLSSHSDIVALMVFEHQMHMVNLITRVGWEARTARYLEEKIGKRTDDMNRVLSSNAQEFVDYLLFVDEAPLTGKIQGTSGFAERFAAQGPRDKQGRSLRQFDLERRLMRHPCSYMIYSEAFENLPAEAKDAIYQRMWQVLSGEERAGKYARLSIADRRAIVEILRETKRDLPDYFGRVDQ